MDFERALEAQRIRLLRLVTGWLAAVVLVSGGSLALPLPRWVRVFVDDLLARAECAAGYLVRASACMQANDRGVVAGEVHAPFMPVSACDFADDVPSTAALVRRMRALRRLLQDLPRRGRRLLRPLGGDVESDPPVEFHFSGDEVCVVSGSQWLAPKIERPPDTS